MRGSLSLMLALFGLVLVGNSTARAQVAAKRVWTNSQGQSEEIAFQKLMPGGIAVFKGAANRVTQVRLGQLAEEDQEIAKLLFLAKQTDLTKDGKSSQVEPFGVLNWDDTPSELLTKLHRDGYERINASIKKNNGRDEYEIPIVEKPQRRSVKSAAVMFVEESLVGPANTSSRAGPEQSHSNEIVAGESEYPYNQIALSAIPPDAIVMLKDIDSAVLASDWKLTIESGPVWIEGTECKLIATFESNYGLLVDQSDSLDKVALLDNSTVGTKECILPCFLASVTIEFSPDRTANVTEVANSSISSLHGVLIEKYRPLMESNLRLASMLKANFGERPDRVLGRARQLIQMVDSLPKGQHRINLQQVFTGSESGFRIALIDAAGHIFETSVGRTQGARSGLTIGYDVGRVVRNALQKKADEANFRTESGGKNRAGDI